MSKVLLSRINFDPNPRGADGAAVQHSLHRRDKLPDFGCSCRVTNQQAELVPVHRPNTNLLLKLRRHRVSHDLKHFVRVVCATQKFPEPQILLNRFPSLLHIVFANQDAFSPTLSLSQLLGTQQELRCAAFPFENLRKKCVRLPRSAIRLS